jgi:hypothetical protein
VKPGESCEESGYTIAAYRGALYHEVDTKERIEEQYGPKIPIRR